jgi:cytochrome c-type biogenesis protein CcmH
MPDQPFKARLAQWRADAVSAPGKLRPDEVAAMLREVVKTHPDDPRPLEMLGRLDQQTGDAAAAARDFDRAVRLDPNNAEVRVALGLALAEAAGAKGTPDAETALRQALAIDPRNPSALYYLGVLRAGAGDRTEAAGLWRQLAAELPDQDGRKAQVLALADRTERGAPAETEPAASSAPGGDQAGFIRGMVANLQARLNAQPDDPAGWARLVRSYRVLGDETAEDKALARARTLFARRPKDLAAVEAEAK